MGYMSSSEKAAKIRAISAYVKDVWQGAGTYLIEDFEGPRLATVGEQEDLQWEIFFGWWPCDSCEQVVAF